MKCCYFWNNINESLLFWPNSNFEYVWFIVILFERVFEQRTIVSTNIQTSHFKIYLCSIKYQRWTDHIPYTYFCKEEITISCRLLETIIITRKNQISRWSWNFSEKNITRNGYMSSSVSKMKIIFLPTFRPNHHLDITKSTRGNIQCSQKKLFTFRNTSKVMGNIFRISKIWFKLWTIRIVTIFRHFR